jgi:hypothetical protein
MWQHVSHRLATLTIPLAGSASKRNLTLVGVYAPTNDPKHRAQSEAFYEELQTVLDDLPASHLMMVLGDFNARVGGFDEDLAKIVGRFGIDDLNDNGRRLMQSCVKNDLAVMGTFFSHKQAHKYTWVHASTGRRHMIDHVLVPVKHKDCVKDWRTVQHSYHTTADHRLVRMEVHLRISLKRDLRRAACKRLFDRKRCHDAACKKAYQAATHDIVFEDPKVVGDFQQRFEAYIQNIRTAFHTHFSPLGARKRKSFVSDSSLALIEEKRTAFLNWQQMSHRRGHDDYDGDREAIAKGLYKVAAKRAKKSIHRDKSTWIEALVSELENVGGINHPDFFKQIRSIFAPKHKPSMTIRDKDGKLIDSEAERLSRWHEWGEGIFNVQPNASGVLLGGVGLDEVDYGERAALRDQIPSEREIAQAIAKLATNKAADRDGVVAEMLKLLGPKSLLEVARVIHEIWDSGTAPESWSSVDLVPIYKGKGDTTRCDSYRPIALIDMVSKAFGNLLRARVVKLVEPKLLECQAGFRKGRSCQDMTFTLRMLRGYANEYRVPLHACFVDLRKAYDSIDRDALWRILPLYGVNGRLLDMIKLLYVDLGAFVRISGSRSERISLKAGVKQGCVLSPILFNIYLDYVVRQAMKRWNAGGGVTLNRGAKHMWHDPSEPSVFQPYSDSFIIQALLYADDTALVATSHEELQDMMIHLNECVVEWGLTVSFEKTEAMAFGVAAEGGKKWPPLMVRGKEIGYVDKFKYLGSIFTPQNGDSADCDTRIAKAWACFRGLKKVLRLSYLPEKTRIRMFKVTVIPTLTYGAESWVLSNDEVEKLEVVQMRMLRSILNISLREHRSNVSIRQAYQVPSLRNKLAQLRLAWFGKVMRMELEVRWPVMVLCGCIWGKGSWRQKGRPPLRWTDLVQEDLRSLGLDVSGCVARVKDVPGWRELCERARDRREEPEALQVCGGTGCDFQGSSRSEMSAHRRACAAWVDMMRAKGGTVCIDECGFVAKTVGGLKTHQRSCKVLRAATMG